MKTEPLMLMRYVSCHVLEGERHKPECNGEPKPRPQVLLAGHDWTIKLHRHRKGRVYALFMWTGLKAGSVIESNDLATEQEACAELLRDLKKERRLAQAQLEAIDDAIGRLSEES